MIITPLDMSTSRTCGLMQDADRSHRIRTARAHKRARRSAGRGVATGSGAAQTG